MLPACLMLGSAGAASLDAAKYFGYAEADEGAPDAKPTASGDATGGAATLERDDSLIHGKIDGPAGGAPAEPTFFQNQQAEAAALIAPPAVPAPLSVLPSSSGAAAAGEGRRSTSQVRWRRCTMRTLTTTTRRRRRPSRSDEMTG